MCGLVHGEIRELHMYQRYDYKYYFKMTNTHHTDVKLIKKRNEEAGHIMEFYERIKIQTGKHI